MSEHEVFAEVFIDKKSDYYLWQWDNLSRSPLSNWRSPTWNWAACLGLIWLLYRKMYIEALALFALQVTLLLCAFFLLPFPLSDMISRALPWVVLLLTGAYGNALYHRKFLRVMRETDHLEEEERLLFLSKQGGTRPEASFLAVSLQIVLLLVVS